ncbi:MAG: hypothetical protein D6B26_00160 [Spirochaetaceae bacterium]|nr:MAG: hypothetical protein D6B26_00160 [Spirochaetaceae bacterium]
MNKWVVLLLLIIPLLLFANAYQAFRFVRQEDRIARLDKEQRQLIEENKKLITEISSLMSPQRILEVVKDHEDYQQGPDEPVIYIQGAERD